MTGPVTSADSASPEPVFDAVLGVHSTIGGEGVRVISWFSCGTPSAVATKLALATYRDVIIARTAIPSEHPDNERFAAECERWFGQRILPLKSDRYADTWDVWEKRRFLVSPKGALCTTELKKMVRHAYERPGDIQIFGYAADKTDVERANRFRKQNPDVNFITPLIDAQLTKADCHALVARAGITLPAMYRLGYTNNNCRGCVKGGMGYWNKIRVDFPDIFERMARLQRHLNVTTLEYRGQRIFLDELPPNAGNYGAEPNIECSFFCQIASETVT